MGGRGNNVQVRRAAPLERTGGSSAWVFWGVPNIDLPAEPTAVQKRRELLARQREHARKGR